LNAYAKSVVMYAAPVIWKFLRSFICSSQTPDSCFCLLTVCYLLHYVNMFRNFAVCLQLWLMVGWVLLK